MTAALRSGGWPLHLRTMSFAITAGVAGFEMALVAIPIALILWLCGAATLRAFSIALVISLGWGLAIAVYSHLIPIGFPRGTMYGGGG
jgi:hypothetical protein